MIRRSAAAPTTDAAEVSRTEVLWINALAQGAGSSARFAGASRARSRVTCVPIGPDVRLALAGIKPSLVILETDVLDIARAAVVREVMMCPDVAASAVVSTVEIPSNEQFSQCLGVVRSEAVTDAWFDALVRAAETIASLTNRNRFLREADPVTGLVSRSELLELSRAGLPDHHSVAILNLDRFRLVNDALGFDAGDLVLLEAAGRVRSVVRSETIVARWSAAELALILGVDAKAQLEALRTAILPPFTSAGGTVALTATIGAAPIIEGSIDRALVHAASAVRRGRKLGGNMIVDAGAEDAPSHARWFEIDRSLRHALTNDELLLHYQPQFAIDGQTLLGFEALLRWKKPGGGLVPPGEFIPALEASGAIVDVGAWVIEEACRTMARWRSAGMEARVAVNVSAAQLRRPDFVAIVDRALLLSGLPPGNLELELTESILLDLSADLTVKLLAELKGRGIRVSIDDFGTGYSSLSYLRHLSVDVLKIDRAFVNDIHDPKAHGIVTAIISIARALGLKTIAEGVETPEQLRSLALAGCDELQGFLLARPMPADAIERWHKARSKPTQTRPSLAA